MIGQAEASPPAHHNLLPDTAKVTVRSDRAYFDMLARDRAFRYKEVQPSPSLFSIIWQRIQEWLSEFISGTFNGGYRSYIILFLLIVVVSFVILKLLGTRVNNLIFSSEGNATGRVFLDENIEEINFESLIDNAVKSGDYKSAVRYHYLNTLKKLSANDIIKWAPSKTNLDYYFEIKESALKSEFRTLSLLFNYIEYGSFDVNKDIFTGASSRFDSFYSLIGGRQ